MTAHTFVIDNESRQFRLDGEPFHFRCGELHYARIPRPYWRDRLRKARAMGLNSVCAYLFWNAHEPQPGTYRFDDHLDVAEFIRMAQAEGLWVILRPGPYSCAEWDFGGLPWWLLKQPDVQLRCSDPRFTEPARRWLLRVGEALAPLQCTRGGPILLTQVENEYGSFGRDKQYLCLIRDTLREADFDVPLYTCDGPSHQMLTCGTLEDLPAVANFGSKAETNIDFLQRLRPDQPAMCGEFWWGWFDHWGQPRQGCDALEPGLSDIRWMLKHDVSFSLYMFHGGTSFGFSAGANWHDGYRPTATSYDYHAPLDEAGRPTPKFHALREQLAACSATPLPELPQPTPVITIDPIELNETALLHGHLPTPTRSTHTQTMEQLDQAHGLILYRTDITGMGDDESRALLRIQRPHDYAIVSLNNQRVATLDRRLKQQTVQLDNVPHTSPATLDILVDAMGRVNYGSHLADRKGITNHVEMHNRFVLTDWHIFNIPLDDDYLSALRFTHNTDTSDAAPHFRRGTFTLSETGDTFINMQGWGKGYVWVNGHNLGRYWSVGPQQTLYCPGCWLRQGSNHIVVLDLLPTGHRQIHSQAEPMLGVSAESSLHHS